MESETPLLAEEAEDFNGQEEALRKRDEVKISVDLAGGGRQLEGILREVDRRRELYGGPAVQKAVQRYEQCWLPLLARVQVGGARWQHLVPPLDVEWIWLCHRLSPVMYEEDCENLFRKTIDSALQDPLSFDRESGRATCRKVWDMVYPNEPYDFVYLQSPKSTESPESTESPKSTEPPKSTESPGSTESSNCTESPRSLSSGDSSDCSLDSSSDSSSEEYSSSVNGSVASFTDSVNQNLSFSSRIGFDLVAAVERQRGFFYQIDRCCFQNLDYMRGSLQRYRLFLNLLRIHRGTFLVPTYDIDLLWHAHMMFPISYKNDTIELLGRILDHDDSDDDRSEGKKNELGYKSTSFIWDKTYGIPYDRAGAMYRGEEPKGAPSPPIPPPLGKKKWKSFFQQIVPSRVSDFPSLSPRIVFNVHIMIWGIHSLPSPIDQPLFVRIRSMKAAPHIELDSNGKPYSKGYPLPQWKKRYILECERSSQGIILELMAEPKSWIGQLWGSRVLGTANLEWEKVQSKPGLFLDTQLDLSGFNLLPNGHKCPNLHVAVSMTPPEQGPFLLRSVFMRGTDDSGSMICEDVVLQNGFKPQVGRWVSRTVLDHMDREVFVVRKRVATGIWDDSLRPKPVLPRERVIIVHEGGWKYLDSPYNTDFFDDSDMEPPHCRVGSAEGPIVAQSVPQPTSDTGGHQEYAIVIGSDRHCRVTITRDKKAIKWIETLKMEIDDEGGYPARLLLGRHLQYLVPGSSQTEEQGFVTLIRYTPLYPNGKAMGLFNWRTATLEASPEENPLLLLLLSITFTESLHEMEEVNRAKPYRRVRLPLRDSSRHWDAISGRQAYVSKSDDFKFGSFEKDNIRWWNLGTQARSPGAGGCGGGACGPSSVEGSPGEIYIQSGARRKKTNY